MKVQSICAGLMIVAGLISVNASADQDPVSARARAEIFGCTDPTISGVARLSERRSANGIKRVDVKLRVDGLPPGRHAVHIHEVADCEPCADAGGHFDPGPNGNSSPDGNHPFHLGDLINVVVNPDTGRGRIQTTTTRSTLSDGPLSLFDSDGSAFMIHANPDTFCPDGPVPGCSGGERVACGIIEPVGVPTTTTTLPRPTTTTTTLPRPTTTTTTTLPRPTTTTTTLPRQTTTTTTLPRQTTTTTTTSTSTTTTTLPPRTVVVTATSANVFDPASERIRVNDTVRFINPADGSFHDLNLGNSELRALTDAWVPLERTFTAAGVFTFRCMNHAPNMNVTITVE